MPFFKIPDTSSSYAMIAFDRKGHEQTKDEDGLNGLMSARLLETARQHKPPHIFLFVHGWKGDMGSAQDQYDQWIKALFDRPGTSR